MTDWCYSWVRWVRKWPLTSGAPPITIVATVHQHQHFFESSNTGLLLVHCNWCYSYEGGNGLLLVVPLPLLLRQRFISICIYMIHWGLTSALQLMADGHYCRLIVNSYRLCFGKFLIVITNTILIICTITIIFSIMVIILQLWSLSFTSKI